MQTINAADILRHKPPFRFVEQVILTSENRAMALVPANPPATKWAACPELSVLPVEYAAQVMGVLIRSRLGDTSASGVLAGITEFAWDFMAESLQSVELRHSGTRGSFHDFKAEFLNRNGIVCAQMAGFVHLSPGDGHRTPVHVDVPEDAPIYDVTDYQRDGDQITMSVSMRRDCPVYAGHFPDAPLTPGVLIAEMMLEAACHNRPGMGLRRLNDLVFKSPLLPGDVAELKLKEHAPNRFSATLLRGGKRLARAKLELDHVPATASSLSSDLISS